LQKIPQVGDRFEYEGHRFTVEEMEGHRIAKVQIEKLQASAVGKAGD
jgi:CBS domain containing-hemolysin-like protein